MAKIGAMALLLGLPLACDSPKDGAPAVCDPLAQLAIEYVAVSEEGQTVAVLVPEPVESYEQYRLFLGPDALVEREIASFERLLDGGTTTIAFDVDGAEAVAFFPTPYDADQSATLTIDGVSSELTLLDASALDDAEFLCLVP